MLSERTRRFQDATIRGRAPLGPGAPPMERPIPFGGRYIAAHRPQLDLLLMRERAGALSRAPPYAFWHRHIAMLVREADPELDDGFEFAVERASDDADLGGGGQRWSVTATVAGRQFERVAIDVGFASEPVLEPETLVSSQLLAFADVEPVQVPAVAIEQHVAEKLHAYTRTYASETPSFRVKDLVDLVVIANTTELDAERLMERPCTAGPFVSLSPNVRQ